MIVLLMFLVLGGAGFYALYRHIAVENAKDAVIEAAKVHSPSTVPGFNPTIAFAGLAGQHGLALDPSGRRLVITTYGRPPRVYAFDQVVGAEVQTDTETVTSTKGEVSMGGMALATALMGPLGLAAGAKTRSSSVSKTQVSGLSLKLYVSDLHAPMWTIPFLLGGAAWPSDDPMVQAAAKGAGTWFARFKAITAGHALSAPPASALMQTQTAQSATPVQRGWVTRVFGS